MDMWVWMQDGKIIYPVTPIDEMWQSLFTTTERVDACRIPDEILDKMTTLQLLLAAIDYPMSGTLYMYSDMETGFEVLTEYCGALEELLSRADCMKTVKEYYVNYNIPENKIVDWSRIIDEDDPAEGANAIINDPELLELATADYRIMYAIDLMEMIMASKTLELDSAGQEQLINIILDKKEDKDCSELFEKTDDCTYLNVVCEQIDADGTTVFMSSSNDVTVTLRSPSGNTFTVRKNNNTQTCDYEVWAPIVAQTPGAVMVTVASKAFNCHSYAWLSDLYPNDYTKYWLDLVPSALYNDPAYKKEKNPLHNGEIVHWESSRHSGRLYGTDIYQVPGSGGKISPKILSKWSNGPMVLHYINAYEGFECGVTYYYKYK